MLKYILSSVTTILFCASVFTIGSEIVVENAYAQDYEWINVTNSAAWAPRDGAGALVYDDKMWLLGGWNPSILPNACSNDVWSSTNGADWTLVKPDTFNPGVGDPPFNPATDWEGRHTAGYAVHDNKMWIVGGDPLQGHYQPDVWNSTDGATWTHVNQGNPAPWGERVLHHTTTFQNKIWVMGGQTLHPYVSSPPEAFHNDVWNSSDGVNWTPVTTTGPMWEPRGMIGNNVVFNDRMWILGGGTYNTPATPTRNYYNDVWSSADGVSWTKHLDNAPWDPRQYHEVAVFDNKMWVMEGYNGDLGGNRKDVWYSENGVDWTEVPNTPWNPRHAASVYTYDDALWMVAGNNMQRDVWKLVPKQSPPTLSASTLVVTDTSQVRLYTPDLSTMTASATPGGTVTGAKFLTNGNVVVANDAGELQLYSGADLSPIGAPVTFAESVSKIVPLADGNYAVAATSSDAGTNHGVWLYSGTSGSAINQNVNWQAPVTHLIETTKGNIAFAVDPAGDGNGSVVVLDGATGNSLGWSQDWGTVEELIPLSNADGDVLFTATNDNKHGMVYPNTWATINGTTGGYKYSNPNWDYVPTVAGTENGEIVWSGNTGAGSQSYLYRYAADGTSVGNWGQPLSDTQVEDIVELANGNIAITLMWNGRGDMEIVNSDLSTWVGSNYNWDSTPTIAAIRNENGDLVLQGVDTSGESTYQGVWQLDGTDPSTALSQAGDYPDIVDIVALPNGNMLFSTSGNNGDVVLWTTGTDDPPTLSVSPAWYAIPEIAGFEDNYTLFWSEYTNGQWYVYAGDGVNGAFNLGELTEVGGRPLFVDHFIGAELPVPGDFNDDGVVDVSDLGILATYYGTTAGADLSMGDANGDGAVNVTDLGILATNYGTGTEAASVPEPGMTIFLGMGALALVAFGRRQRRQVPDCGQTRCPPGFGR